MEPQTPAGEDDQRPQPPAAHPEPSRRNELLSTPAWPLGCGLALLALVLIFNLLGLTGILFAASGLPVWASRGGPILIAIAVPALMLWGGLYVRRRNPYASRALLWGVGLTIGLGLALTILFNVIDRLSGM